MIGVQQVLDSADRKASVTPKVDSSTVVDNKEDIQHTAESQESDYIHTAPVADKIGTHHPDRLHLPKTQNPLCHLHNH
jgi:hypothetical protein